LFRVTERPTTPWIAFLAGAVAMLAIALLWFAWQGRDEAAVAAKAAAVAMWSVPELKRPRLPEAPHIPDNPVPRPE
jgi:hypothetical protein